MTMTEVLKDYDLGLTTCPKKGQFYLAVKNHGGDCTVMQAGRNWKYLTAQILIPKKSCNT